MPLGSRHEEVGLLRRDGAQVMLVRDDGGVWRLDGPEELSDRLGRRVAISGVRIGYDRLEVERIDGEALRRPWIWSWEFGAGVAFTLFMLALTTLTMFQD